LEHKRKSEKLIHYKSKKKIETSLIEVNNTLPLK